MHTSRIPSDWTNYVKLIMSEKTLGNYRAEKIYMNYSIIQNYCFVNGVKLLNNVVFVMLRKIYQKYIMEIKSRNN